MKNRIKQVFILLICSAFAFNSFSFAEAETLSHNYPPIEYTIGNEPIELWTPWMPIGVQILLRLKLGICLSAGSIQIKNPIKVTLDYDSAQAKGGKTLKLKFKAQAFSPTYNTFQSDFGIYLPNKIQFGLASATGIGSLLPWIDVPYDFWDAVSFVPKVGTQISSAAQQIGVNMASREALTIGTPKSFHDARDLISFNLADAFITDADKNRVGQKIMDRLPGKSAILTTIMAVTGKSSGEASAFLLEKCAGVLPAVAGKLATVSINGDPYYTVEGINVCLNVRYFVEGAGGGTKGSGTYPLYFTSDSQIGEINFGITPFINPGDKVKVIIDKITYEFKLTQDLQFNLGLSLLPSPAEHYTKLLCRTQVIRDTTSEHAFEIPLQKSTDAIQLLDVHKGYSSAQVKFASPYIALKTTVDVHSGSTTTAANKVKTVSESQFKNSHNIIVTDLTPNTQYSFLVDAVDASGTHYSGGDAITIKTLDSCPARNFAEEVEDLKFIGTPSATTGLSATDGYYIDFSWQTSINATTMVYYSPSPDIAINYVAAVKRNNNTVTYGWATSSETPWELVTSHSLRAKNLEPGITYHYIVRSYAYENDNLSTSNYITIGKIASIATQAPPAPPSVKVQVQGPGSTVVPNIIILISKTNDASYASTAVTGTGGFTPPIMLDKNSTYKFSIKDHQGYLDAVSSNLSVADNATGELSNVILYLIKRPSPGGYVYDVQGNRIQGATASSGGKTAQTDNNGWYKIDGLSTGSCTINVTKTGFFNASVAGTVDAYGLFSAPPCVLTSKTAVLNIAVRNSAGSPVANASVAVKEGNTSLGSAVTTNASGQAVFSYEFSNTQTHNLSVTVTPPASSGLISASENVSVAAGSTAKVDLICNQDTTGPAISGVTLSQTGERAIQVNFSISETGTTNCVEYQNPQGQTASTTWSSSSSVIVQNNNFVPGLYKIKVKSKDASNNVAETGFTDFTLFGGQMWNVRVANVKGDSVLVMWDKYPYNTGFSKYILNVGTMQREITNRNTVMYTMEGLTANSSYTATVKAVSTAGVTLTIPGQADFRTLSRPPVASIILATETVGQNQQFTATAVVDDPDTNIQKIVFEIRDATNGNLKNTLADNSAVNSLHFSSNYPMSLDEVGKYEFVLYAKDEGGEAKVSKKLTVLSVDVSVKTLELSQEPYLGKSCKVNMVVKNKSSNAIQECYALFEAEDGAKQKNKISLTPESEKTVLFTWVPKKEGEQVINGSIECEGDKNTEDNKISKRVVVKKTGTETQEKTLEEQKKTEEEKTEEPEKAGPIVDVSVKTLELPQEPYLGKSCKVNMVVKNSSSNAIQECYAFFETEDSAKQKKVISLTPESEKTVIFTWVPKKEGEQVINGSVECEGDKNTEDNKVTKNVVVKKIATEEDAKKKP